MVPEVYIHPGESKLVRDPAILKTVLGSCVGITFRVPRLGIGAICHPMLPHLPAKSPGGLSVAAGRRYVDYAIHDLIDQLDALGATRSEIEVKVFGGADVLPAAGDATRPTVGKLNSEMAVTVLREEGFNVVASCLGGTTGIQIQFHTGTGEVLLRRFNEMKTPHRAPRKHSGTLASSGATTRSARPAK